MRLVQRRLKMEWSLRTRRSSTMIRSPCSSSPSASTVWIEMVSISSEFSCGRWGGLCLVGDKWNGTGPIIDASRRVLLACKGDSNTGINAVCGKSDVFKWPFECGVVWTFQSKSGLKLTETKHRIIYSRRWRSVLLCRPKNTISQFL